MFYLGLCKLVQKVKSQLHLKSKNLTIHLESIELNPWSSKVHGRLRFCQACPVAHPFNEKLFLVLPTLRHFLRWSLRKYFDLVQTNLLLKPIISQKCMVKGSSRRTQWLALNLIRYKENVAFLFLLLLPFPPAQDVSKDGILM